MGRASRGGALGLLLATSLGAVPALPAAAQDRPLFDSGDAWVAGAFVAATGAAFAIDAPVARVARDSARQASAFYHRAATGFRLLDFPGAFIVAGGLYVGGRLADDRRTASLGLHMGEAMVAADATVLLLKWSVGRARPYASPDDPFDFDPFAGGEARASLPSGHTATAFAAASALTAEMGRWWPDRRVPIGLALYGAATLAGASRIYDDRHWTSDVVLGAAIGTFAGWKVVRYSAGHPGNDADRIFLTLTIGRTPTGRYAWSLGVN